jgi:thiol-disulfide isomerase/thioredoxin
MSLTLAGRTTVLAAAFTVFSSLCLADLKQGAAVNLSLHDLNGNQQSLQSYRGKIVILNFWATWCVPCRVEMPVLVEIQRRYASLGVVVVGASADDEETQPLIGPFVEKLRIPFPIWTGATIAHMEQFGLGAALPATAIIDQQGQIAFRIIGVVERRDLTARLDYLLSAKQGKAPEALIDTLSTAKQDHNDHEHGEEEEHAHGGVGVEGASMVPS